MRWPTPFGRKEAPEPDPPNDHAFALQVRELARDLVTLEINTIIKSNMTAERMPTVPNALLEIARDYLAAFVALRADVSAVFAHRSAATRDWRAATVSFVPTEAKDFRFCDLPDPVAFGDLFECLRWAAKNTRHALVAAGDRFGPADRHLLGRIENNADTLRTLLDRYSGLRDKKVSIADVRADRAKLFPPYDLTTRDFLIIRKIWEIGTERVVAQTSIQLDGDVVTRMAEDLTRDRERADQILALHRQGIETGVGNWRAIVEAAVAVVQGVMTGRAPRI